MRSNPGSAVTVEEQERVMALYSWLSTQEMADRAGNASDDTVREWITTGQLKAMNVGTRKKPVYRIRQDWASDFIEGRTING